MFSELPPRYDLINSIITLNMDKRWRRLTATACLSSHPKRVLDLCCGTGDLAITVAQMADYPVEINGLDFSQPMLEIARRKAMSFRDHGYPLGAEAEAKQSLSPGTLRVPFSTRDQLKAESRQIAQQLAFSGHNKIEFIQGEASQIPFPDGFFDCIGISFAFRNLTYQNPLAKKHLSEIMRVLKPGGRFVIVETSQPESKPVRSLYHIYMRQFVSRLGYWISGNKGAYRYLAESASRFYSPPELEKLLIKSGFKQVSYRSLLFGAAGIYVAVK